MIRILDVCASEQAVSVGVCFNSALADSVKISRDVDEVPFASIVLMCRTPKSVGGACTFWSTYSLTKWTKQWLWRRSSGSPGLAVATAERRGMPCSPNARTETAS